ncbi:MAG: phosphoribosylglycinamide formyltransferase [Bacteroidales bacterium]
MRKKISIFVSGNGSNAEALYKYFRKNSSIEVVSIISNRKNAGIFERANSWNIPVIYCSDNDFNDENILNLLRKDAVDFIILAGFLKKIPEHLVHNYENKIINIHPALLPAYGGKGMYGIHVHEAVLKNEEKRSGITIHLVDNKFDNGKILFQQSCNISEATTAGEIASSVQELEHTHYAPVIENYITHYKE